MFTLPPHLVEGPALLGAEAGAARDMPVLLKGTEGQLQGSEGQLQGTEVPPVHSISLLTPTCSLSPSLLCVPSDCSVSPQPALCPPTCSVSPQQGDSHPRTQLKTSPTSCPMILGESLPENVTG